MQPVINMMNKAGNIITIMHHADGHQQIHLAY